ncbi:MAG: amylo-alpha-1,6-glucosidase [Balneolaceae bacterium]
MNETEINFPNEVTESAKKVLEKNWTGSFTKPTANLYPHQWSWDSCFIAIGYAHYDRRKAMKELDRLFHAQWKNGMIPHIVFDESELNGHYFPGPDFWKVDCSPDASKNLKCSGICQPPVHSTAVLYIMDQMDNTNEALDFANSVFENLVKWHNYLYKERDPDKEGLAYIRHPWESGQDNSPVWDPVLNNIKLSRNDIPPYERKDLSHVDAAERPTDLDYDRYVYLVDLFRKCSYNEEKIRNNGCPFLVQDVLFNTILCQATKDLAEIAKRIGKDPRPWQLLAEKTADSINRKLWDKDKLIYVDFELTGNKQIHEKVLAGFLPLYAGIPDSSKAEHLFNYLNTHCFCRLDDSCFAATTFDRSSPEYSSSKYWRGPIWINLNWMLCLGLSKYGYNLYADKIMESIIRLPAMSGFYEYFDPDTGKGYGSRDFSWTAALLLDVVYQKGKDKTGYNN